MKELDKYLFNLLTVFKKPFAVGVSAVILSLTTMELACVLLITIVALDYGTGVYASWYIYNRKKKNNELTIEDIKSGWFTSEKWKGSIFKSVSYMMFIFLSYFFQLVFHVKHFKIETYFEIDLSLSLCAIMLCFAVEFYSIFWENLPKVGVNIPHKISSISKSVWALIKTIKNG